MRWYTEQQEGQPDHGVEGEMDQGERGRTVGGSHRVQPDDPGMRAEADQERVSVRNGKAEVDAPVHIEAPKIFGNSAANPGDVSIAANLTGC